MPKLIDNQSEHIHLLKGSTVNINLKAGSDGWWIIVPDSTKSWCVITKIYGSGDYQVPVKFKLNATGAHRTSVVTLNPTFSLKPVQLTFTQSAN